MMIPTSILTSLHEDIDDAIVELSTTAPWLIPAVRAVRDHAIAVLTVANPAPFWPPSDPRPLFIIVADDGEGARGPLSYDGPSLRALFGACGTVVINAAEAAVEVYQSLVDQLLAEGLPVVIVETMMPHVEAWTAFILGAGKAPGDVLRILEDGELPEGHVLQ